MGLTGLLCNYIPYYVRIAKSLQDWKTELLSQISKNRNPYQLFTLKTKVYNLITYKLGFFKTIQALLSYPSYLVYLDPDYQIFIDLDVGKKFRFGAMIYHLKGDLVVGEYSAKKTVELILFLS